jgi:hypothetical protein
MQLQPTVQFMDTYVAPGYSSFTTALIRDMSTVGQEQGFWVENFILNGSPLRVTLDDDTRRTFYNFLRRTESAFLEYEEARRLTMAHLENPKLRQYISAIGRWERFLSDADRAWALLVRGQPVLFGRNDGSSLQRLNLLYNRTKHIESAIKSGQLPPNGTLSVWLTNEGLEAVGAKLAFNEMADILCDLAKWADAVQDPLTMRENIKKSYGLSDEGARSSGA